MQRSTYANRKSLMLRAGLSRLLAPSTVRPYPVPDCTATAPFGMAMRGPSVLRPAPESPVTNELEGLQIQQLNRPRQGPWRLMPIRPVWGGCTCDGVETWRVEGTRIIAAVLGLGENNLKSEEGGRRHSEGRTAITVVACRTNPPSFLAVLKRGPYSVGHCLPTKILTPVEVLGLFIIQHFYPLSSIHNIHCQVLL